MNNKVLMQPIITLKNQINIQFNNITSLANYVAYVSENSKTNRIIILTFVEKQINEFIIENKSEESILCLKLIKWHEQITLAALFETYFRIYSLKGQILAFYQTNITCNLAEFNDYFVAAATYIQKNQDQSYLVATTNGKCFESTNLGLGFQLKSNLNIKITALAGKAKNIYVADQKGWLYKIQNLIITNKLNSNTNLPIYVIEKMQTWANNCLVCGCTNGQILLVADQLKIIVRVQAHANIITTLSINDNKIYSGSEDGCINVIEFIDNKLISRKTQETNKLVAGIFIQAKEVLVGFYQSNDLYRLE